MSQTNTLPRTTTNPLNALILAVARRFGSKSKEVERFLKFAVVGTIGAALDFGILYLLQATILPPKTTANVIIATSISFLSAVCSNFIWNRYWTYPDSRSRPIKLQLVQFTVINVIGWLGREIWVTTAYHWLGTTLMAVILPEYLMIHPGYIPSATAEDKLGTMAAMAIGLVVVMIWNFIANRLWTYGDVE